MLKQNNPNIDAGAVSDYLERRETFSTGSSLPDGDPPSVCHLDDLILDSPAACIRNAYRVLLRREPDVAEQQRHERRIREGGSRVLLLLRLRYGREGRRTGVRLIGFRARLARGLGSRLRHYRWLARVLDAPPAMKRLLRLPAELQQLQREHYQLERQYKRLAARLDDLAIDTPPREAGNPVPRAGAAPIAQDAAIEPSALAGFADGDAFYLAFEEAFRGSEASVQERLEPCLACLAEAGVGGEDRPVMDLGSGRGEWLALLHRAGLTAYGVDTSGAMVGRARSRGLDVTRGDAEDRLAACESRSLGAVTAFHLVEHLPFNQLVALLDHAFRTLVPGGVMILETPNPENLRVGANTFWTDPTHRRPLPPRLLAFLAEHCGFSPVRTLPCHSVPEGERPEPATPFERAVAPQLFGPQDYRLIAWKPA